MKRFKKLLFAFLLFALPSIAFGATLNYEAAIDDTLYTTLEEAVLKAIDGDTIKLLANVTLENTLTIDKDITIDMNEFNIEAKQKVLKVENGNLVLTGKGTIRETVPDYYAIILKGSRNEDDLNYSTLTIGEDITVEGWSAILIDRLGEVSVNAITTIYEDTTTYDTAYGIKVDVYGKLISKNDTSDDGGFGIYINGNIKHMTNYPEVHIYDGASIDSTNAGIYMAGYGEVTIDEASINGIGSGIAMKSGVLNLNKTNVTSTGEKQNPISYADRIGPTGAAILIESNNDYAGNMIINISDSDLYSENNSAILEYIGNTTTRDTSITEISINGNGTYTSNKDVATLELSDYFSGKFITGGYFSKDPTKYVASEYKATKDGDMYKVTKKFFLSTMAEADSEEKSKFPVILIIIGGAILVFVAYKLINKYKNK